MDPSLLKSSSRDVVGRRSWRACHTSIVGPDPIPIHSSTKYRLGLADLELCAVAPKSRRAPSRQEGALASGEEGRNRLLDIISPIVHAVAPATTRSASFTRSSPEMSLGSNVSRRAASVRDSTRLRHSVPIAGPRMDVRTCSRSGGGRTTLASDR